MLPCFVGTLRPTIAAQDFLGSNGVFLILIEVSSTGQPGTFQAPPSDGGQLLQFDGSSLTADSLVDKCWWSDLEVIGDANGGIDILIAGAYLVCFGPGRDLPMVFDSPGYPHVFESSDVRRVAIVLGDGACPYP